MKRKSSRKHKRIDYVALNEGVDLRELDKHPHIERFKQFVNDEPIENNIYLVDPTRDGKKVVNEDGKEEIIFDDDCLAKIISKTRLRKPIMIKNCNPSLTSTYDSRCHLSFKFPKLTIDDLTNLIGPQHKVPVMDVQSQNIEPNWDMEKWCHYFKLPMEDRNKVLNVISLEFSQTGLAEYIELPKVVTDINIVNKMFDAVLSQTNETVDVESGEKNENDVDHGHRINVELGSTIQLFKVANNF
ncbi:unnamed protein product [Ambrosiozyma monospora]|uniref:Unnamed protein product n=1 Tax=Ambrosiozyma monospora TaxID=43982 RepID=A0ACB5U2U6_AMBMO|nr:unnamed protein product [Ambrosiozyma monospora]